MFDIRFQPQEAFSASFEPAGSFDADFTETIEKPVGDFFTGAYEYTPGDTQQVIPIASMVAVRDIVINAVPKDTYGHLAWNGAYLSVY